MATKQQLEWRRRRRRAKLSATYWLTPRAWRGQCSHCDSGRQPIAYRRNQHRYACVDCIDRLGIQAKPSKAAAASNMTRVDPTVTVTFSTEITRKRAA